ncbi:zona pellucida sperm-binding protein 3-like isoform X2 [Nerophis lumbriciformis]|uniref:zona pellucida sperm-binding protein 3-like isoform X2 n=1 Tax=Nerophis lumbriciformis TaxID=546530 RepID=UPI003BA980C2
MVMKCTAVCLLALAFVGSFCDAQYPMQNRRQDDAGSQQSKNPFEKPVTWIYPEDPQPPPKVDVTIEIRHPVSPTTVAVDCRERDAHVEVKKDFFGIGQAVNPEDLTLGNCGAVGEDTNAQVLIYESELHNCGSELRMTDDSLIYQFKLFYSPSQLVGTPIVRTPKAVVIVECHYPRNHNVSSLPLDPHWVPYSAIKVSEEFLYFSLTLMTTDWMYERPRFEYFLGDMIFIEASVKQFYHVPLRVYVDSCVATLSPDINSNPRYGFIQDGCLVDASITGSNSRFMQRTDENKLRFLLEAFRFLGTDGGGGGGGKGKQGDIDYSNRIYITCYLRATSTSHSIDSEHRACSYIDGWREASGVDTACSTCSSGGHQSTGQGVVNSGGNTGWNPSTGTGGGTGTTWGTGGGGSTTTGGGKPWIPPRQQQQQGSSGGSTSWSTGGGTGGSWGTGGTGGGGSTTTGGGSTTTGGGKPWTPSKQQQQGSSGGSTSWSTGGGTGTTWGTGGSTTTGGGKPWTPSQQQGQGSWSTGGGVTVSSPVKKTLSAWVSGGGSRKGRSVTEEEIVWRGAVTLGPIAIGEQQ